MKQKKIDIHGTLKKHKLKPIEIKSNKLDSKSNPEDKKETIESKPENEEPQKETSFHENILEESIDFAKPALSIEETIDEPEKKETLEETAARIASPFQTSPITTNDSQKAYATGLNSSSYSNGPIQNSNSSYQSSATVNPFLEKENRDRSIFGIPPSSNSSGFDNLRDEFELKQERYRNDQQSQQNTGLPFEEKRKRHEIRY